MSSLLCYLCSHNFESVVNMVEELEKPYDWIVTINILRPMK
jgi:hypothetical protein